jgi:hypothetical protein
MDDEQIVCGECGIEVGNIKFHIDTTGHTSFKFLSSATYGV